MLSTTFNGKALFDY